jgi:hypothetical protein
MPVEFIDGFVFSNMIVDDNPSSGPGVTASLLPDGRMEAGFDGVSAIASAIGGGRTGLRISPVSPVNDAGQDSDAKSLFNYLVEQLAHLRLAFIHVIEGATGGNLELVTFDYSALRDRFKSNNSLGRGSSTTATRALPRWPRSQAVRPIWWPSAGYSSAIPIWSDG